MSSVEEFSYDELLCLQRVTELILNEENLDNALKSTLNILSEKMGLKRGIISIYQKDLNEIHHDTFGFEKNSADIIKFAPGEATVSEGLFYGAETQRVSWLSDSMSSYGRCYITWDPITNQTVQIQTFNNPQLLQWVNNIRTCYNFLSSALHKMFCNFL